MKVPETTSSTQGTRRPGLIRVTMVGAITTVMTAVLTLTVSQPARADYFSGGMPSRSFNVRMVGINPTWVACFDHGAGWWNGEAGARIWSTSTAASTFTAGRYSQSWLGHYQGHGIRHINRTFTIQVNARTLQEQSGAHMTQWMRSTCAHELGHSLSLADNPNTSQSSLMKHNRNRTTLQGPTAYDIREVERIY